MSQKLTSLCSSLQTPMSVYPPVSANPTLPLYASSLSSQAQKIMNKIDKYKSKVSKSK